MTAPTDKEFKSFIDRVLRLKEEQDSIGEDIKGVYAEMKQRGYDKTAAGTFVGELRKKEKNPGKFEEGNAILDLYRDAYNRASGTVVATHTHAPDREALAERRKRNFSESMDDTKALSAEAVALGLIDPEAHAETARIADALAVKFGNGPLPQHDPETGEIQESRPTAHYLAAEREGDESSATNHEMDRATEGSFETGSEAAEKGREAIPAGPEGADLSHAGADESSAADGRHVEATVEQRPSATNLGGTLMGVSGGVQPAVDGSGSNPVPPPTDDFDPSKLWLANEKPDCLKLKNGHCRISFSTSALCSECANARQKARASA